jgi:hypothetical protein
VGTTESIWDALATKQQDAFKIHCLLTLWLQRTGERYYIAIIICNGPGNPCRFIYHNMLCVRTSPKCYMLANISSIFTIETLHYNWNSLGTIFVNGFHSTPQSVDISNCLVHDGVSRIYIFPNMVTISVSNNFST